MLENCTNSRHAPIAHMVPNGKNLSVRCPLCAALDQLEDFKSVITGLDRVSDQIIKFLNDYPKP